jgi:3-deoxy-D-manno-octulosonate 8-phosphate phosphatase (KDO 8-P phosphatase)
MVQRRADELGIQHLHQGVGDKLRCAERLLQEFEIDWNAVCYIGDDLPDVAVMQQAGLSVAPADAARDAREAAHWTMRSPGGHGAVRELIERLLRAKNLWQFKAG